MPISSGSVQSAPIVPIEPNSSSIPSPMSTSVIAPVMMSGSGPVPVMMSGSGPVPVMMSGSRPAPVMMSGSRTAPVMMSGSRTAPPPDMMMSGSADYTKISTGNPLMSVGSGAPIDFSMSVSSGEIDGFNFDDKLVGALIDQ